MVRAVLEGVGHALRDGLDLIEAARGDAGPLQSARASGGGARSELWLRILASILELPIERTESEAGAAYGAAVLGGVAGGVFPDARSGAQLGFTVTAEVAPDPGWVEAYAAQRERYRALYPALSTLPS
jgi:xylulokinase